MEEIIISTLQYLGIAPDKLVPIILVLGISFFFLYQYWLKPIKKDIKEINDDLTNVNNATCEIQSYFKEAGFRVLHLLTMKPGSPFVLTEYGEKLVKESGFPQLFQKNRERIIQAVKSHIPQTNYDIQEYSKTVLLKDLINNPMMNPIKDYAFKNSIRVEIILEAAALVVRDEVMKELRFDNNL